MLADDNHEGPVYLLDFQHARFHARSSTEVLMFEAGYFAGSCRRWIPQDTIDLWLSKLLNAMGITDTDERDGLKRRFRYYFSADLSRKERMKIQ